MPVWQEMKRRSRYKNRAKRSAVTIRAPAVPAKNIKSAAVQANKTHRIFLMKGLKILLVEYDQYRLDLHAMEKVILELRDSL